MIFRFPVIYILASLLVISGSAGAQEEGLETSVDEEAPVAAASVDEALGIFRDLLQIDTSNPPGNEIQAARYLADLLRENGVDSTLFEPVEGRASLFARLEGSGQKKPLLLLQHLDVVPTSEEGWLHPPFAGLVEDGFVWGRGALDMKSLGAIHVATFLALARSEERLSRDVILLATADEEAGSRLGAAWFIDNHRDLVEDVGLVLTEGGSNLFIDGRLAYVGVEVAQKVPLWLRIRASGQGGHSSVSYGPSAAGRLIRGLNRVLDLPTPRIVEPVVSDYLQRIAPYQPDFLRQVYEDPSRAVDGNLLLSPHLESLLRNTISVTILEAGTKTNVLPDTALAEIDCRLLPGQDPEKFLREVLSALGEPVYQVEKLLSFLPYDSPPEGELFEAVAAVIRSRSDLTAEVGPSVSPGFTDSHFFRAVGIPSYGFSPFTFEEGGGHGIHGINERISLKDFRFGFELFWDVLERLVYAREDQEERLPNSASTSGGA